MLLLYPGVAYLPVEIAIKTVEATALPWCCLLSCWNSYQNSGSYCFTLVLLTYLQKQLSKQWKLLLYPGVAYLPVEIAIKTVEATALPWCCLLTCRNSYQNSGSYCFTLVVAYLPVEIGIKTVEATTLPWCCLLTCRNSYQNSGSYCFTLVLLTYLQKQLSKQWKLLLYPGVAYLPVEIAIKTVEATALPWCCLLTCWNSFKTVDVTALPGVAYLPVEIAIKQWKLLLYPGVAYLPVEIAIKTVEATALPWCCLLTCRNSYQNSGSYCFTLVLHTYLQKQLSKQWKLLLYPGVAYLPVGIAIKTVEATTLPWCCLLTCRNSYQNSGSYCFTLVLLTYLQKQLSKQWKLLLYPGVAYLPVEIAIKTVEATALPWCCLLTCRNSYQNSGSYCFTLVLLTYLQKQLSKQWKLLLYPGVAYLPVEIAIKTVEATPWHSLLTCRNSYQNVGSYCFTLVLLTYLQKQLSKQWKLLLYPGVAYLPVEVAIKTVEATALPWCCLLSCWNSYQNSGRYCFNLVLLTYLQKQLQKQWKLLLYPGVAYLPVEIAIKTVEATALPWCCLLTCRNSYQNSGSYCFTLVLLTYQQKQLSKQWKLLLYPGVAYLPVGIAIKTVEATALPWCCLLTCRNSYQNSGSYYFTLVLLTYLQRQLLKQWKLLFTLVLLTYLLEQLQNSGSYCFNLVLLTYLQKQLSKQWKLLLYPGVAYLPVEIAIKTVEATALPWCCFLTVEIAIKTVEATALPWCCLLTSRNRY